MSKTMENVKTLNSVIRTCMLLTILALMGYAGWYVNENFIQPSQQAQRDLEALKTEFDRQASELEAAKVENERLTTSIRLLKVDHRLANIEVLSIGETEDGDPYFDVAFVEVDQYGDPIAEEREYRLKGEKLYVDCWTCKFEDHYIEQADELRSATLCIFKTIFGDGDGLENGYALDRKDENGELRAPGIYYRGAEMTEFEEKIWSDFWKIANDRKLQEEMGIRATEGKITYVEVQEGRTYEVKVRASGGTTLRPLPMRRIRDRESQR